MRPGSGTSTGRGAEPPGGGLEKTQRFGCADRLGDLKETDHPFAELDRPFEGRTFRSHSDASPLFHRGTIPVVCGPGRLEVAHTPDEHVDLAEVHRAAELYAALFHAVCC